MKTVPLLVFAMLAIQALPVHAQKHVSEPYDPFEWPSKPPADCPFEPSDRIVGFTFTGRHQEYTNADTWLPSWASDGNLYSPFTDGSVVNTLPDGSTETVWCWGAPPETAQTGHAKIVGDDPLDLKVIGLGAFVAPATPYDSRYPSGSLVHNGIWYHGSHVEGPTGIVLREDGSFFQWPWIGPFLGFRISVDYGKTWTPSPHTPLAPMFVQDKVYGEPVRIGEPFFVDFGKNMEHSPDGKAYLVAHGAAEKHPLYPFIVKSSFNIGDHAYLLRVDPTPATINDPDAYEFFAGHDAQGKPVWTTKFDEMKPLIEWDGRIGITTITYNPHLKRYLFVVTDGRRGLDQYDTFLLESEKITGPWKLVKYMEHFGEQAYFVNIPSKFIGSDGRTLWLCYPANFGGSHLKANPPGSRYAMCLHEIELKVNPKPAEPRRGSAGGCGAVGMEAVILLGLLAGIRTLFRRPGCSGH